MLPPYKPQCAFHEKLGRIADSLETLAHPPGDCGGHLLSVTALHSNGTVAETPCGEWLREAGCDSVHAIRKEAEANPVKAQHLFVARMRECASRVKGVPEVTDSALRRFFQGAVKVARYITRGGN
jgi:hypothetical protein